MVKLTTVELTTINEHVLQWGIHCWNIVCEIMCLG